MLRSVTEIFKTPGKLRGKTPRTARKRDPIEGRAVGIDSRSDRVIADRRIAAFRSVLSDTQGGT
jgi:hypothetical protein